jgi:polysaccharide deacetylase 2 family uncharacterized protein YibQ
MVEERPDGEAGKKAVHRLAIGAAAVFLTLIGLGLAITFFGNPHAGEAETRLDLTAKETNAAPSAAAAEGGGDSRFVEQTDQGPLPRIAPDGTPPMRAYAARVPPGNAPRVALVVTGLGVGAKVTESAINLLPSDVTLAFAPYGGDVQHWVREARLRGHEVLVEIPMEPADFPDSDPGPYMLRAGAAADANQQRLIWSLTRFSGYVGATNLAGSRFMAEKKALTPVLSFLAEHGLLFFGGDTASAAAARDAAIAAGVSFVASDAAVDAVETPDEIDKRLAALADRAKMQGRAAGTAFAYPVAIERISAWARALPGKGVVLAPLTAVVSRPK